MLTRNTCFCRLHKLVSFGHRSFFTLLQRPITTGLAGTAPAHTSYTLLSTQVSPLSFPNVPASKLIRPLQLLTTKWGGLVNLAWVPSHISLPPTTDGQIAEWDPGFEGGERYSALVFSAYRAPLVIPELNLENLEDVAEQLRQHASPQVDESKRAIASHEDAAASPGSNTVHLYVCTHGARDCRCGETGGAVFAALRDEVERRQLSDIVKVGGVGHVGGHKYAANVLVFPYGEWLGQITPATVPIVLDAILSFRESSLRSPFDVATTPPLCRQFWRGRMGLNKEEQLQLISSVPAHAEDVEVKLQPHASRA